MDPEPLSITEPIVRTLDFREHDLSLCLSRFLGLLFWRICNTPQDEVRDASTPLSVFLSHHLAYSCKSAALEAFNKLHEIINLKVPVQAYHTGPFLVFFIPDLAQ
ncbi:hypothetical protein HG531_011893 [Fusarium graminearum]|nr:hypothetical protein HG531_011893 [Fusarium graminearum]